MSILKKLFHIKKPNNSDKVFTQWIEFVKEDENVVWFNSRFRN